MCINVYNTSEVSYNIKFMSMRLKHWDKDEGHLAFPHSYAEYTKHYILRHYIKMQKNHINSWALN